MVKFYSLASLIMVVSLQTKSQNIPGASNRKSAIPVTLPAAYTNIVTNYIRTWDPSMPSTDPAVISAATRTVKEVKQTTQYFDGLGRLLQTVSKGISPSGKDLVAPIVYDELGREQFKYLPYVQQNGNISDGKLKINPFADQKSFYGNTTLNPGTTGENIYYSQIDYEASPLNRVTNSFAPGNSWAKTGGYHPVSQQYLVNTADDSVRIWDILPSSELPTSTRNYAAGELYKNVTIDEAKNQIIEYRDKEDKVVLKKVQLATTPGKAHMGWLCTYYVYDDLNNLRTVIPPLAVEKITGNWNVAPVAAELCFIYRYDGRNRMIIKKIPGADSTEMVYDVRDRMVFSRNGNLREKGQWISTFYDGLNRPTMTALYSSTASRSSLQISMDAAVSNNQDISYNFPAPAELYLDNFDGKSKYEATKVIEFIDGFDSNYKDTEGTISPAGISGTQKITVSNPLPNIPTSALTPLTYTFYDDYSFTGSQPPIASDFNKPQAGSEPYAEPVTTVSNATRGLVTGSKVRVIDTDQWLTTTSYYDNKGRVIQTITDNASGGQDVTTSLYNFNGKLLSSYLRHKNPRSQLSAQTTVLTQLSYDAAGRPLTVTKQLNDNVSTKRVIAANTYDELGQLTSKRLGVNGTGQLEKISYEYNIRGWLKSISKDYIKGTDNTAHFGQELSYDYGFRDSLFNGNIAGAVWKGWNDTTSRSYGYLYDKVNRLTGADYTQRKGVSWTADVMDFTVSNLTYDANGNIKSMWQKGLLAGKPGDVDKLTYNYKQGEISNKLARVTDAITADNKLGDFTDGNKTGDDYQYDSNGNLTKDLNKKIDTILYNHLNLPQTIRIAGKGEIVFQYDAAGIKIRKIVRDNTGGTTQTITTDYIGGFVYKNDTLQFAPHEEGRTRPVYVSGQQVKYYYDYFVKDHLGNIRLVLTDQSDFAMYAATMESSRAATENQLFSNLDATRTDKPAGYPEDVTAGENKSVAKLSAKATDYKIGPSLVIRVMAGDTIQIGARAFYKSLGPQQQDQHIPPVEDMVANLVQTFAGNSTGGEAHGSNVNNNNSPFTSNFYNNNYQHLKEKTSDPNTPDKPKAYLNFVLFDDQFNLVEGNSGVKQVKATPDELQTLIQEDMPIMKSGFLYVYTSNESQQDVFFDNVTLGVKAGPVLEETHYYPFGGMMAGISSVGLKGANYPENKFKFNGKEIHSMEFSDGSGLAWYDYGMREYDHQIGRFFRIDPISEKFYYLTPYQYASNDPILNIDLDGLEGISSNTPWVIAIQQRNVQEKINKAAEITKNAMSAEVSAGVGVGVTTKIGKVGVEAGIGGPAVKVSSNLGGEGEAKVSLASAGASIGKGKIGIEAASAKVEFGNGDNKGKVTVSGLSTGADMDLSVSKDIKSGNTSSSLGADGKTGEVSIGVKLGVVGASISVNFIKVITAPFLWLDAAIENKKTEIQVRRQPEKYLVPEEVKQR